jgi:hypothetical protein
LICRSNFDIFLGQSSPLHFQQGCRLQEEKAKKSIVLFRLANKYLPAIQRRKMKREAKYTAITV